MPYANIHEAFTTYTESFSGGSAGGDQTSSLGSIKNPFNIEGTDPGDDFDRIATNYVSDGYNQIYKGGGEWDILDEEIRGLQTQQNQTIAQSPDRIVGSNSITPVTTNRRIGDRVWDRQTGAEVDQSKRARDMALRESNPEGVRMISAPRADAIASSLSTAGVNTTGGSTPLSTQIDESRSGPINSGFMAGAPIAGDCSDQTCLQLLNHILGCDNCAVKFKKLMNVSKGSGSSFLGIDLPEINLSKLMFWIILIILIVAVYELLNTLFKRLTKAKQ